MRLKTVLCMFVLCFFFSSMPVAELAVKYGDVNRDGRVTMTDVSILLQYCQGRRPANTLDLTAADVNGDGKVNILDVTVMKEYVVGRISSFPAEKNSVSQNQSQSNRSNSQSQARTNASNSQNKPQANVQTVPSGAVVIKSDGWYRISPLHAPGRAITVDAGSKASRGNIHLWDYQDVPHQKFYLEHRGDGYYTMRSGHCDLYVDAEDGVPENGKTIHQFTYNGSTAQLWRLIDAGGGAVYIETKMKPGMSFDCKNRQGANGTDVQIWERGNVDWNKWKLTPVDEPPLPIMYPTDGWYRISPLHALGRAITVDAGSKASEGNIHLWDYQDVSHQKFYLEHRGNGYYTMRAGHSDLYVDAKGGVPYNGRHVQQFTYNDTNAQMWRLLDAGNGAVYIETKLKPGLSFDCKDRQGTNGTDVQLWKRGNVDWNKWKLTRVSEVYNNMNDYKYKNVQIVRDRQVVDTFNGVEAIYPLKDPGPDDGNWNCASLVKKYYEKNYGVTPYNLRSNRTPMVNGKQMKKVSSPQIGDIVGMRGNGGKVNGHWAIVKEIEGNNVILFEQNWRSGNKAPVNRRVSKNQVNFYRL